MSGRSDWCGGIGFPANHLRGCVSVSKPQHTALPTSKGVVWTRSYANTNSLSLSLLYTHTHTQMHKPTYSFSHSALLYKQTHTLNVHWWKNTSAHSFHTNTHMHIQREKESEGESGLPVLSNRNTQGAVCWMVGLGLGGGRPGFPHLCLQQ